MKYASIYIMMNNHGNIIHFASNTGNMRQYVPFSTADNSKSRRRHYNGIPAQLALEPFDGDDSDESFDEFIRSEDPNKKYGYFTPYWKLKSYVDSMLIIVITACEVLFDNDNNNLTPCWLYVLHRKCNVINICIIIQVYQHGVYWFKFTVAQVYFGECSLVWKIMSLFLFNCVCFLVIICKFRLNEHFICMKLQLYVVYTHILLQDLK